MDDKYIYEIRQCFHLVATFGKPYCYSFCFIDNFHIKYANLMPIYAKKHNDMLT